MKIIDVPQRGKRGKIVASRNRFGQFICENVPRHQPATEAQTGAWVNMDALSRLWNEIEEERREAWRRRALDSQSRPTLGQSGALDGRLLFLKLNRTLATCRRDPLLDPPPDPQFLKNPVTGFKIRKINEAVAFRLEISSEKVAACKAAGEDIMVFAWAPRNAGVAVNSLYAFIGLLPEPDGAEVDITNLYLTKLVEWKRLEDKRYHVKLDGARIFVRVWQQVNGWENELGMFRASDFVPRRTPRVAGGALQPKTPEK
jgi:hypothetical protein